MLEGAPHVVKTRWVNYTVFLFGELLFDFDATKFI
jgi:hypothetical protein